VALCPSLLLSQSVWNFYVDFIRSKNQVTNMDDVCKLFDFVVLCVFNFLCSVCVVCVSFVML